MGLRETFRETLGLDKRDEAVQLEVFRHQQVRIYQQAGEVFFARRIAPLFTSIKNQDDVVLHNDAYAEITLLLGDVVPRTEFMKAVAKTILEMACKTKKEG